MAEENAELISYQFQSQNPYSLFLTYNAKQSYCMSIRYIQCISYLIVLNIRQVFPHIFMCSV